MAALSSAQRLTQLDCWYDQAQAAGISLCEKLAEEACASLNGGASGLAISSTSSGGHSVSFFDRGNQPIDPAGKAQFVALAYQACKACTKQLTENPPPVVNPLIEPPIAPLFTDADLLECIKGKIGVPITSFVKSYWAMRGCGCGC